jgi:hypothetical protein
MDKIVRFLVLALSALALSALALCCLSACHFFDDSREMDTVAVYFDESNVTVFEGGLGSVTLRVEPTDALTHGIVEYEMGNEEVAAIYRADKRGCVFYGRKKGSTVLTARISGAGGSGGAEAKMVITVMSIEKEQLQEI